MPKFYSTGVTGIWIPVEKRKLFNLTFESVLLRYNVRAYFGAANSKNQCPLKLIHLSLSTSGPSTRMSDLKMAKRLIEETLTYQPFEEREKNQMNICLKNPFSNIDKNNSPSLITIDDSTVEISRTRRDNQKEPEIITILDEDTPKRSKRVKDSSQMPLTTIPEAIELDGSPCTPCQNSERDISVVNLLDDSISNRILDKNNDNEVEILSVKLSSSPNKCQLSNDLANLEAKVALNKKLTLFQNQGRRRNFQDLSNISTPVKRKSESDVIALPSNVKRPKKSRKNDGNTTNLQENTRCLRDRNNLSTTNKMKAVSDVIVLSSNVNLSKKSRKSIRNNKKNNWPDLSNTSSTSSGFGNFTDGQTSVKLIKGKLRTPNQTKVKKGKSKKIRSRKSSDTTEITASFRFSLNNDGSRNVSAATNKANISKKKKQTPGSSKEVSKYYEALNAAANKVKKIASQRKNNPKPFSPKRKSGLANVTVPTREKRGPVSKIQGLMRINGQLAKAGSPKKFTSAKNAGLRRSLRKYQPSPSGSKNNLRRDNLGFTNVYNPNPVEIDAEGLRPIVVDGCNIAYAHGRQIYRCKRFSGEGVRICVDYFYRRGHREIKVFFPLHFESEMDVAAVKRDVEAMCEIVWTPSRVVDGVRKTSYDDRFIVQYAAEVGGVIVSRDMYRDLKAENQWWKDVINTRLLMPTFVGSMLMFPVDPLGPSGPTLEEFLKF